MIQTCGLLAGNCVLETLKNGNELNICHGYSYGLMTLCLWGKGLQGGKYHPSQRPVNLFELWHGWGWEFSSYSLDVISIFRFGSKLGFVKIEHRRRGEVLSGVPSFLPESLGVYRKYEFPLRSELHLSFSRPPKQFQLIKRSR